ncbi:hypothetical protein GUI12_04620 [Anaplasmataceae bacterium AB001_6]|nr:hypothetical protein GUI12_04620 [Anaplasmataceae bacterium AB001_6]
MAGHSQYSNRKRRIESQSKKKNKVYLVFRKLILKALKEGSESGLRNAIHNAQKASISREKIDIIINSADKDKSAYEDIVYEGYGPKGIAFVLHISTDNRNRTAGEIRSIFNKHGGNLGENGSVAFLFNKRGLVEYDIEQIDKEKILEAALETNALDIEDFADCIKIYCEISELQKTAEEMYKSCGEYSNMRISWQAKDIQRITDKELREKISLFYSILMENDDVMYIDTNCDINND